MLPPGRFYRRALHALDNHGVAGSLRRAFSREARRRDPGPAEFAEPAEPHPFDRLAGTDTSGYIPGEQLPGTGPGEAAASLCNTAYYGISPSTLWAALARVPVDAASFTFIDIGCGKGRALMVAANFGFARVAGVELAPRLAKIARANTAGLPNVIVATGDASAFIYPPGPLVVFLYRPFLARVQRCVLRNLARQIRANPRPVWLLSATPAYPESYSVFAALDLRWEFHLPLSAEDAAADRHGIAFERYALWRVG